MQAQAIVSEILLAREVERGRSVSRIREGQLSFILKVEVVLQVLRDTWSEDKVYLLLRLVLAQSQSWTSCKVAFNDR